MAAAYHPAGRKRWLAARGGHARGETARAGAAEQHDGQAPATAAAATQFHCGPLAAAAGRGNIHVIECPWRMQPCTSPGCLQQLAVLHQWHHRPPANPAPQPAAAAEMSARRSCVLLLGAIGSASASDNGRARQPPMGCESAPAALPACLTPALGAA